VGVAEAANKEESYVRPAVWSELHDGREPAPDVEASRPRVPIGYSWLWNRWPESKHCQQLSTVGGELGGRVFDKGAADSLTALARANCHPGDLGTSREWFMDSEESDHFRRAFGDPAAL
jgi:hypothetical protein